MADVEAQLEANGLPTQFESSSNQPAVTHAVDTNASAIFSNAEASELKQNAPDVEVSTVSKPAQSSEPTPPMSSEAAPSGNDMSLETVNPAPEASDDVKVNGLAPAAEDTNAPSADASFTDSGLPASLQSDMQPAIPSTENALLTQPVTQDAPALDKAPESDLRTAPHSDNLSSEAVAAVEAEKHAEDDKADVVENSANVPAQPEPVAADEVSQDTAMDVDPPKQPSPPPAPEPAHAELPTQAMNGTVIPTIEAVDASLPAVPVPTLAVSAPALEEDQEMVDAPSQPTRVVREREDEDNIDERAAKRMRTDEDTPLAEFATPKIARSPAPKPATSSAAASKVPAEDDEVTPARVSHMKKVISNLKKSNASQAFRLPVDYVALKIPSYPELVKHPMDLSTIDNKLKANEYSSVQTFKNDFTQIIKNCLIFNGPEHAVTVSGRKMETSFNNQMAALPALTERREEKKPSKPKVEPIRAPPPRRQSITAKAASPKAPSPAIFAPDPNGVPLIRRDSTLDGRPKRAIVPPKRNSDFGGARPKKKKYELELRFCDEVLKTISSPKHWTANQYFTHPVDPVALNIPTYFQVIKKPMDLATVRQKLDNGLYEKARDFEEDVRLIFKNCYKFNPEGDYVHQRGQELERLFSSEWLKKQDWITAREPDSEPASVEGDDSDEASDEEPPSEDEDDQSSEIAKLQAQLELIQSQMGQLKSKKKSPGATAIGKKSDKKKKVKSEKPSTKFPGLAKAVSSNDKKSSKVSSGSKKAKPEKDRYVTFAEKQYISNGIAMLPERPMSEALKIIQNSVPALANSDQGEIELDIEEVPNHALLKLLSFVKKYAGPPPDEPVEEKYTPTTKDVTVAKKKGKSMSKHEQEAQIAELKGTLHSYAAGGAVASPDALASGTATGEAESEDDDESGEESEEE